MKIEHDLGSFETSRGAVAAIELKKKALDYTDELRRLERKRQRAHAYQQTAMFSGLSGKRIPPWRPKDEERMARLRSVLSRLERDARNLK